MAGHLTWLIPTCEHGTSSSYSPVSLHCFHIYDTDCIVAAVAQCTAFSANLCLPALPANTLVQKRHRQIAVALGVSID